jgi:undecaprenyl-diphosphatase
MDFSLYLKAILMGLVEGLTEFLPVSSTGHLILFGDAIRFTGPQAGVFEVVIQIGAIAAVLLVYQQRFIPLLTQLHAKPEVRKFLYLLIISFLPAAVIGLLAHHAIKTYLFNPTVVALALIIGGIIMLIVDRIKIKHDVTDVDHMTFAHGLKIGFFQVLAMIPGVSRSGATIIGGMLCGLDKKTAAEFSFFLAVPTLLAAGLYDLYKGWETLTIDDLGLIASGFVSSFIFGYLVIVAFIQIIVKLGFTPFAIYRIVLGLIILAL